jgi:endonuclease/exonuclease/phosphatase family metal-dependent hydrolase
MLTFVFWNLMGHQADGRAARMTALRRHLEGLAASCDVDVLIVAESPFAHQEVLNALNGANAGTYHWPPSRSRRVHLYTRLAAGSVVDRFNDPADGRLTIRKVQSGTGQEFLLAATHFQSQLYWSPVEQALQATRLAEDLRITEDQETHQRLVLVGDLNMNPFDPGLTGAHALNAVMSRDLTFEGTRTVAREEYRYFYNPMWGCFGDRTPGPPGTHYHRGGPTSTHWHLLDQVLLRPALMDALSELRILDAIGSTSLLTAQGRPQVADGSDHLPLLFRLDV